MATITGSADNDALYGTTQADNVRGLAGDDYLSGGAGRDSLYGGAGNDRLYGGSHQDHYDGGVGFDLVDFIDNAHPVAVDANLATRLATYIGHNWPAETMIAIEGLVGGNLGDKLYGDGGDNYLEGRTGGDTISGGGGNDEIIGGYGIDSLAGDAGNDTLLGGETWDNGPSGDILDGGTGFDLVSYVDTTSDLTIDLASGSAGWTRPREGSAPDRLIGIEAITGGSGRDRIGGNAAANSLVGGSGADTLIGGAGNDTLVGGDGDDSLWGGAGNDVLDGGDGIDIAIYRENTGPVRIDMGAKTASFPGTNWRAEYLYGIEGAETGSGNDTLAGNHDDNLLIAGGGRDSLLGGYGADTLDAGAGIDTVNGGAGFDTASFASVTAAMTANLATGRSWATANSGTQDILIAIEAATGGSGNDHLIGSAASNRLEGGAGADSLDGSAGTDTLVGGPGQDTLRGGADNDILVVDPSNGRDLVHGDSLVNDGMDTLDGSGGTDTLVVLETDYLDPDYGESFSYYVAAAVNLTAGTLRTSYASSEDRLVSIENVTTADGDDTITGSAAANLIRAGDGANIVAGGGGDDTIHGGSATWQGDGVSAASGDRIDGGAGDDLIYGNGATDLFFYGVGWGSSPGQDTLAGGAGDDTLYSARAHVEMTGGSGADDFHLTDEIVGDSYRGEGSSYYPSMTIRDFSAVDGDRIHFAMVESAARVRFVGEAEGEDLALFDAGYTVEGTGTVVRVRTGDEDSWLGEYIEITLEGYAGGLTADDLMFA
jgi:Ca2+-binding RTX toxin-like protein